MIPNHSQIARTPAVLAIALLLAILHSARLANATPPPAPTALDQEVRYVFGLSPFLDHATKDHVFRHLVRFVLEVAPAGSTVQAVDAYHIQTLTQFEIPRLEAFQSPKTRAVQFREPIREIRRFLAAENPHPESRGLDFTQAVRLPQLLDFVGQNLANPGRAIVVSVLGSPLYQDEKEPGFSMTQGYFPSDGHLFASRDQSVFGVQGREHALDRVLVHVAYFGDPWLSELHRDKISRFWTLYVERQGGRLGAFTGDLPTAFTALRDFSPSDDAPAPVPTAAPTPALDPARTKVEMLRITRDIGSTDWISREDLRDPAQTPPSHSVGPLKIGIRWKGDLDLDLYARPGPGRERLYFEKPRSAEGCYDKDHRSSPGREYEFIEFTEPVDVRQVHAAVNFYEGECTGGPVGEVRIEFEGRIYSAPFSIAASQGNRGREGDPQSRFWATIDIPRILHLSGPATAKR